MRPIGEHRAGPEILVAHVRRSRERDSRCRAAINRHRSAAISSIFDPDQEDLCAVEGQGYIIPGDLVQATRTDIAIGRASAVRPAAADIGELVQSAALYAVIYRRRHRKLDVGRRWG